VIEFGKEMNPWVSTILGIAALVGALVLFHLDHQQDKN
jgi:hypothetical protein